MASEWPSCGWMLRAMHHASSGLKQLHGAGVAHQDLKPSNLLVFGDRSSKVADLGCAAIRDGWAPRDGTPIAGDLGYAPPELLYRYLPPDWNVRRLGCDLYLLGGLLVFFILGMSVTALIQSRLDESHRWQQWSGRYQDVLPYVRAAHATMLETVKEAVPALLADDLTGIVRELCEPEVELRGHPAERLGSRSPFSVERYVSRFDLLARRAELVLLRER